MNDSWQKSAPRMMWHSSKIQSDLKRIILRHLKICTLSFGDLISIVTYYYKIHYAYKLLPKDIEIVLKKLINDEIISQGPKYDIPTELYVTGHIVTLADMINNIICDSEFGGDASQRQIEDIIINNSNYNKIDVHLAIKLLVNKNKITKNNSMITIVKKVLYE